MVLSVTVQNISRLNLINLPNVMDEEFITVLPAKSNSGVMFCLQSYQDFKSIDYLCINPIRRIGLIHK